MAGLRACLGPSELARCPHGTLVGATNAYGRCGPCQVAWQAGHPHRPPDDAERAEHAAILAAWLAEVGPVCAGADPTIDGLWHPPHPHPPAGLTVDHWSSPVALGGPRSTGGAGKRVICRTLNSQLGGRLGAALKASRRPP